MAGHLRIPEVLDFGHVELSHSEQPGPRSDLISKTSSYLRGCERDTSVVEFVEFQEIYIDALCSFGS